MDFRQWLNMTKRMNDNQRSEAFAGLPEDEREELIADTFRSAHSTRRGNLVFRLK